MASPNPSDEGRKIDHSRCSSCSTVIETRSYHDNHVPFVFEAPKGLLIDGISSTPKRRGPTSPRTLVEMMADAAYEETRNRIIQATCNAEDWCIGRQDELLAEGVHGASTEDIRNQILEPASEAAQWCRDMRNALIEEYKKAVSGLDICEEFDDRYNKLLQLSAVMERAGMDPRWPTSVVNIFAQQEDTE
ncbi:hypothetical protein LQW54_010654 [Pestalotiopsis sp. IQ-011]